MQFSQSRKRQLLCVEQRGREGGKERGRNGGREVGRGWR